MRLPRKWVLGLGLLAAAPGVTVAGPLDFLKPRAGAGSAAAGAPQSNTDIANAVADALRAARLRGENIEIEVLAGMCTLKGQIADSQQRDAATSIVAAVPGVESVDNQLVVTASSKAPRTLQRTSDVQRAGFEGSRDYSVRPVSQETPAPQDNQETAQQIAGAIASAGLSGYDIEVRCKDGIAGLKGEVGSPQEAMIAAKAAKSVPGVTQVLNGLTVNGQPVAAQSAASPYQQVPNVPRQNYVPGQNAPQTPPGYPAMPAGYPQANPAAHGQPVPAQTAGHLIHNRPNMPEYAWPSYAPYDNYAQVTYPAQYDASAWPYIGPFYPYPQVPAEWRSAELTWDDGYWQLKFHSRTGNWWWFLDPHNWH
jgi:osmotically-inducible protein OsmY